MAYRQLCYSLLIYVLLLIICTPLTAQSVRKSNSGWSGSITFISRNSETVAGNYNGDRYIEGDFLSETRMDAAFENETGSATHRNKLYRRNLVRDRISSVYTHELITTERGSSEGTGSSVLSISINEEDKTYSIEATVPQAKGSRSVTYSCRGCLGLPAAQQSESSAEETMILVEDQPMGNNPHVLSGEIREQTDENGVGSLLLIQWTFVRGPIDAELIVTPVNYNEWLPVPGNSETECGSELKLMFEIRPKGSKELKLKGKYFNVDLHNTSKEPGIALNAPLKPIVPSSFDLKLNGSSENKGQSLNVVCEDGKTGIATVCAYDGGAHSELMVTAVLEGGIRLQGRLLKPDGPTTILLPMRNENSVIGEAWLKNNKSVNDEDDKEALSGNAYTGDGLTAFEEYRGVFSEGKFKRLSATRMELGVQVAEQEKHIFKEGMNLLGEAAGIDVLVLHDDELSAERTINSNSRTANAGLQHALKLERQDGETGIAGYNEPREKLNKTPKDSKRVVINVSHHETNFKEQAANMAANGLTMPYSLQQNLAATIAHELGHGIYLGHHGPPSNEPSRYIPKQTPTPFEVFDYFGNKLECPCEIEGSIGTPGNEESGDLSCIMAYTNNYQWVHYKQPSGTLIYKAVPVLPVGTRLCAAAKGTAINANGDFFGDATNGNCLGKLKIRDY